MIKIDLITGFLGSGKTTFIRLYARYLMDRGEKIAIIENDYGAVNVDALLLQDLDGESCEIETIAGGCDHDCHVRRFKTKLIAMGMLGYDRVIVEPSGIYEVDEFFDVLYDEPLDKWYEIRNVIAIVDIHMLERKADISREEAYLLMSQAACAGIIIPSHIREGGMFDTAGMGSFLNRMMEAFRCSRRIKNTDILAKDWEKMTENDFDVISSCGYHTADHIKIPLEDSDGFTSLYFLNLPMPLAKMKAAIVRLFQEKVAGKILRVKGFHCEEDQWYELNASGSGITVEKRDTGQELFIVIGEGIDREAVRHLLEIGDDVWHNGNVYAGCAVDEL